MDVHRSQYILVKFPNLTKSNPKPIKSKLKVSQTIKITSAPVLARLKGLAPNKLKNSRAELGFTLQLGIICPSGSQRSSHLYMFPRRDEND